MSHGDSAINISPCEKVVVHGMVINDDDSFEPETFHTLVH